MEISKIIRYGMETVEKRILINVIKVLLTHVVSIALLDSVQLVVLVAIAFST